MDQFEKLLAGVDREDVYRARLRKDLGMYYRDIVWPLMEPGREYLGNWHIDCIAEHLHAVSLGHIRRLIINVPPRTGKTNLVSLTWPCWTWTWKPEARFIFVSYSSPLSIEANVKRRNILTSDLHTRLFPEIALSEDRNLKEDFANTRTGHMIATSVGGTVTGRGGDILVIDDPINPEQAHSKAERDGANRFIDQTLSTRLDDKKKGAIVLIQQRVHVEDCTAHLKEHGFIDACVRVAA